MINFLKCEAKAVIRLVLELSYQEKNRIAHKVIEVDTDDVYKITVADNECGIHTLNGRIVSFTMSQTKEVLSYVTKETKPFVVDTISVDCSEDGESKIRTINVCDIRTIEELSTSGFEEIGHNDIATFN
jgi:hypothetical protein